MRDFIHSVILLHLAPFEKGQSVIKAQIRVVALGLSSMGGGLLDVGLFVLITKYEAFHRTSYRGYDHSGFSQ